MAKKKRNKKNNNIIKKNNKISEFFVLPEKIKKWILGIIIFILVIIIILSFFNLAGSAGVKLMEIFDFLIGFATFIIPFILVLSAIIFFRPKEEKFLGQIILGSLILIMGTAGILGTISPETREEGGYLGYLISLPFLRFFGTLASQIIFLSVILIGLLIFWNLLGIDLTFLKKKKEEKDQSLAFQAFKKAQSKIKEIEGNLKSKEILMPKQKAEEVKNVFSNSKIKPIFTGKEYKVPPLDLLTTEKGKPSAGDTLTNSAIIKETLKNFGLDVEMGEINIGPTVTQYTLKPAEGIKLSKITSLSNNLSLALASSSIRIEAPIPGKSLVGIEIPNKERCPVRLKDLISNSYFQEADSNLVFVLGRDVSGAPFYADLSKMPHLLVAGSTGAGKTVFLNSFILSLLYRNSPEILRIILIDPKRVEFSAYQGLPHLLAPVIFDAQKTINVLKWLIKEMERRFDILSRNGSRDIVSYNEKILKEKSQSVIPYIVLIIDELADLMAARGKEIEGGIVRLAQMARAVGIHLVLATQRPSVEVITGLIKANITSRVAFQVASQVDSRTIIDTAGAEKLLGGGDLLFNSAQTVKPKRIQGAYVSEKEVKKVINYIKAENPISDEQKLEDYEGGLEKELTENHLAKDLENSLNQEGDFDEEEDPLYQSAKKIVITAKKASSSLLQRRLSIGYARAARLIDLLEERGVIGPGEGAKPREVYFLEEIEGEEGEDDEEWKKV